MLQEGEGEHCHERMAVETLPGSPFEVIEAKFLFQLLMGLRPKHDRLGRSHAQQVG